MPIDRARFTAFAEELESIRLGVSPEEAMARLRARLLDWIARRGLSMLDAAETGVRLRELLGEELAPFVADVVRSYQETLDLVNQHYADLGIDIRRDLPRVAAIERANSLDLGNYEDDIVRRIQEATRRAVVEHATVRELGATLRRLGDRSTVYGLTLARTQIKTVSRVAKAEKARIADVQYFEYVGLRRRSNRPFCHVCAGLTLHIDTIHQLRNGNREPVLLTGGGWNCIHDWEPDPFATAPSPDTMLYSFLDGRRTVVLPGGPSAQAEYEAHARASG